MQNQTEVALFLLKGFPLTCKRLHGLIFGFLITVYVMTLLGNLLLIVTVTSGILHDKPMYILLRSLSFLEMCLTTAVTIPRMLYDLLSTSHAISLYHCAFQMFLFFGFGETESILLAAMVYDRYLAICQPLQYPAIMTKEKSHKLCLASWFGGFMGSLGQTAVLFSVPYSGSNAVDHFFCEQRTVLDLSKMDVSTLQLTFTVCVIIFALFPFVGICVSYLFIVLKIKGIKTSSGRRKCFSTCASHLTSVTMYFTPGMCVHLRPTASRPIVPDKYLSLAYCLIIPFLNPLIYSLRNNEVKKALERLFSQLALVLLKHTLYGRKIVST